MPADGLVESYRRLADVFHDVLADQSLDTLLDRIADTLADLVPHDTLTIYEADEDTRSLVPVLARDEWAGELIMRDRSTFDEGISGWAAAHREPVLANQAHLDPRVMTVPGTPEDEPEALVSIPLVARSSVKGVLNMYRLGEDASFTEAEFELAKRFGDAAALALDNAQIRAHLEREAQTDALTGLYNHRVFHERLRAALQRSSRTHAPVAVLMLDIDDFKRVNDVHGHGVGDEVLAVLAETLRGAVRSGDVVCRLGGEEFAVIMESSNRERARRLARRLVTRIAAVECDPVGPVTVSVGIALGPEHAMSPRELTACAEGAMMTAKARGKNKVVVYAESALERPGASAWAQTRDVRSVAHLKMLQSLSGKLNRLMDVAELGETIADELRSLIDYHNCRVFVLDGTSVVPIAFRGEFTTDTETLPMELVRCEVGEGVTGRVAQTGEPLLIGDAARCPFGTPIPETEQIEESLLAVPLSFGSRVIGVIVVSKLGLDRFDEDELRLLEVLAGQAAVALENASLFEASRREAESANVLLAFSRELASAEGMDEILERVVGLTAILVEAPRTSIWLQEAPGLPLEERGFWGADDSTRARLVVRRFEARELDGSDPYVLTGDGDPELAALMSPGDRLAVAPIVLEEGRRGCIVATIPAAKADFGERELRLLGGLAHQVKLAIANVDAFDRLERSFVSTVAALANALEANDEYTSSHARWITDLSLRVGRELGLDGRSLKLLELGALFHDIGKIGVPGAILAKPGRLTARERALVELHPELGERILAPIDRLREVCPIVRHCHERWDGMGYPDGKSREEIPIESRIVFACDAYHAMTTDRPYRKRLSAAEARRRLEQGAGSQFDPHVVEACLRVLASGA
ncbi:MAG TPA: diguanylate cyclase [Gaiellaceae bacterium]